jgi:hypothetical protein
MRRRDFIGIFGSAAAWPLVARAQQPTIPTVGYVHSDSPQTVANLLAAFREGLSEIGYIEGQNVAIEYRWAQNDPSRIPELVADLVRRRVLSSLHRAARPWPSRLKLRPRPFRLSSAWAWTRSNLALSPA